MDYLKKDLGSYNLHLINTTKFKTITIRVVFHTPIKKEEITKRNLLTDILLQSSEKYENRRSLTIKSEELYSADIQTNNHRVGNYIFTNFSLQVLEDKYTESNNLEKSIEFLSDILFRPDLKDNMFKKEKLEIVKTNAKVALESLKEDATGYSLIRMAEAYDKSSPISYRMCGYLEDLDLIDEQNLTEAYQKMIENDYVDIFVVGNFDNKDMITLIKKYFKFKKIKKKKASYLLPGKKSRKQRLFAKETIDNSQSKLGIICPMYRLSEYERNYPLTLGNIILGGGCDSKLFKEVREKNSLCYTIYSFSNKLDNILVISAGIDKDNFTKSIDLITKNLLDMKKGKFTEKDIEMAKEYYNSAVDALEESESRIINEFLQVEILGLEPIEERRTKMNKVSKQDIIKTFKKINMDTVFLLEGVKNEGD